MTLTVWNLRPSVVFPFLRQTVGSINKPSLHIQHVLEYVTQTSQTIMSSSSAPLFSSNLLEALKSSLLQPWLRAKDHGILSSGVILSLIAFCLARYLSSPFRKLPPGPRGFPIIGNLLEMKTGQWFKFAEWHKKYGGCIFSKPLFAHF